MKTRKSYRLSPRTMQALEYLKRLYPNWTETDILEASLETLAHLEKKARIDERERKLMEKQEREIEEE